jgi:dipeptidyl aminopeptidase/acylaminoacyl peptidase
MSIEAMRAGSYPGSDITIEKELTPGSNYRRFYGSYQSEGLKIYALLTVPNGEMPAGGWPAIVFNHGYIPPTVYRTTERYIAYVDNLARAGYIVFRIDYRGNDQSERFAKGAYGDPGYTVDVLNAVGSIKRVPQANPLKIGMYGHSMGGFLTLRAMVISKDIKVGVIWSGPGFWNSVSANAYLADLSGPLQLQHSLTDEEVPPEFSQKLAQDILAVGGTVELYTYKKDDHNLSMDFTLAMNRTIEFINRYLK